MLRQNTPNIEYPVAPQDMIEIAESCSEETIIQKRFMKYLGATDDSREDIRILKAIQVTADMLDYSDAHIAKVLIDLGLRAPRMAFPADFLSFADNALMRGRWEMGAASNTLRELQSFWYKAGDDKFAAFKQGFDMVQERFVY